MGALFLAALYLATSLALLGCVRLLRVRVSLLSLLLLTLLPLAFTAGGFWRQKVIAPTVALAGVSPWASPPMVELILDHSTERNPLQLDPMVQMEPWRRAARDDLLFNPAQGSGAALLANGQSAVLFPLEVVARLLVPVRAATYLQAARLLLAVWGLFLLVRRLGLAQMPSVLASAVYLGSGFLQVWRAHPHSYVAALAPWIVYAAIELARRPGARAAVVLAVLGAAAVSAGHPETLLHVVLLAALVVVPSLISRRRRLGAVFGWAAAAAALSLALAAPVLLPFVENLTASAEWELRQHWQSPVIELPLTKTVTRLAVTASLHLLGDPFDGSWHGPENLAEVGGGSVGAAALVLLPLALARARRRKSALGWLAVGLLGLLVGAHLLWLSKPFGWIPLLRTSLLKRLSLWWALAAAVLTGMAVQRLMRRRRSTAIAWAALASAAGFALLLAGLVSWLPSDGAGPLPWGSMALGGEVTVGLGAALAALCLFLGGRRSPGASRRPSAGTIAGLALLLLLLVLPRAIYFSRWVPLSTSLSFYPETEAVRFVKERSKGWRVAGVDAALVPHSAAFFGLEEVRAYDPMTFAPYERFASLLGDKPHAGWQRVLNPASPALSYLGVKFVFDHPSRVGRPGLVQAYAGPDAVVYENPVALPRLLAPRRFRVYDQAGAALEAALAIEDFSLLAMAQGEGLPPQGEYENPEVEVADLRVERSGRVSAWVVAPAPALLVTSQPAIPGWRLEVDGQSRRPVRVNGAFLGTYVDVGRHRIDFRYAPRSWRWGWLLALLGGVVVVFGLRSPHRCGPGRRGLVTL